MSRARENRLRRRAARQGLTLSRTRRRDPAALDYGLYALLDANTGNLVSREGPISIYTLTLDDVAGIVGEGEPC